MNGQLLYLLNATTGNIIADVLVSVVILIFALVAMRKGFIECFFSLISTLLAIILAFLLMKPFINWTNGIFGLQGVIENACENAFSKIKGFDLDVSSEGMRAMLESQNLPKFLINSVVDTVGNSEVPIGTTIALLLAQKVGGFAISLVSLFLLFFLMKLLLLLVRKLLSSVLDRLPIVGKVNHALGFFVGVLQGLLAVSAVVAVLAIIPWASMNTFLGNCTIVGWMYNHNPIYAVFNWLFS